MSITAAQLFVADLPPGHAVQRRRLRSGLTVEYVEQGRPDGVPVVFLHGVTDSWQSFSPLLPHLPTSIRAIVLSQRGHGDSDRPADGYRARDFAADVADLLDALGIASAIVVGHSMGATHAARLALDHPRRVRGLVLIGAFKAYRENRGLVEFHEWAVRTLTDPVAPEFVRDFQQSTLGQPVAADYFETVVAESLKLPARVWRAAFDALLTDECAGHWTSIETPTLLLWGARDSYSPLEQQYALLDAIAQARFVVYERAGHAVHWEEPARVAADIRRFVDEVTPQSGGERSA